MKTVKERGVTKKIETGDYNMSDGMNEDTAGEKMLVKIGDQRKRWVQKVASLISDGSMTEVLKCVIDQASTEDPESYAVRVEKWKLKSQLDDIERREKALAEEKQRLVSSLEGPSRDRISA